MSKLRKHDDPLTGALLTTFKAVYGSRFDQTIAKMFDITLEHVERLAIRECLRKGKAFLRSCGAPPTKMPRWSADEEARLKDLYPTISNHEIAQTLRRSTKSIVSKAHALGLKKSDERLRQMGRVNVSKRYTK